jgi:hypothetical protein
MNAPSTEAEVNAARAGHADKLATLVASQAQLWGLRNFTSADVQSCYEVWPGNFTVTLNNSMGIITRPRLNCTGVHAIPAPVHLGALMKLWRDGKAKGSPSPQVDALFQANGGRLEGLSCGMLHVLRQDDRAAWWPLAVEGGDAEVLAELLVAQAVGAAVSTRHDDPRGGRRRTAQIGKLRKAGLDIPPPERTPYAHGTGYAAAYRLLSPVLVVSFATWVPSAWKNTKPLVAVLEVRK